MRAVAMLALALALVSSPAQPQSTRADAGVEEILVLRSVRLSRVAPTEYCATSRTGFAPATWEDRYEFRAVATDAAGKVTDTNGGRIGAIRTCISPTSDASASSFYIEGSVAGVNLIGRGLCRTTRTDFPEAGISVLGCQLDLSGLPAGYVGGQLTTNTIISREAIGTVSKPPGYTQLSIATIRLWKKR